MACRSPRRRKKKGDEPIQYVPPEEKKTVIESPAREEPKEGKEGGEPERVYMSKKGRPGP
ncbi:MAG TPA: hypothetical protein VMC61_01530 [Methanocella sp.]|nr:hypothetical protein [Methanocella sp.]